MQKRFHLTTISPSSNERKFHNRPTRSRFLPSKRSRSSSLSSQISGCSSSPQRSRSRSRSPNKNDYSSTRKSRSPVQNSEKRSFISSPRTRPRFISHRNVQRHTFSNFNKVYQIPTFRNSKNLMNSHKFNNFKYNMNAANIDLRGSNTGHSSFLGKNSFIRPYYGKKYYANRNITNYLPSQSKEIPKKFDDINQKLTTSFTISEVTSGDETVKEVDTKPRLLFQTPKSAYESSLRSPLFHKTIISDARDDIIDFILKCCIRLQLPMVIVAAVLKSYHKYHEYNNKRKINWHEQFIDEFDEELLGISCILIEIENTKYFKGIRKAMNIGWRLKYPNIPLDGCDKLKKTVKIMMSNVKNAIGREPPNKTPIKSASRVIRTLKDEFGPNALADPLFNKFVQNIWTMIINCLCSTRIAITYSSDELATAVIYITSGSVGIDLKKDFDAFCVESSGSDPLRIKDAILEIATMKQRNQFNCAELT